MSIAKTTWWTLLIGAAITAAACRAPSGTTAARGGGPSIDEIVTRGKVLIGVNSGAPPFSIVNPQGRTVGYDVDVANLIAGYLGVPAEVTAYPTAARIPALEAGKVDLVIATLSPTPERARVVMFTMPYSAFGLIIVGPKDSAIRSLSDLSGREVGVSRGTPQEIALARMAPKDTVYSRFDDDSTTMQSLVARQVEAIAIPETVFREIMKARPESDLEVKFPFYQQHMSIAVRRGAFELRQWLNTTLSYIKQNGELDNISKKWTGQALPSDMPVF